MVTKMLKSHIAGWMWGPLLFLLCVLAPELVAAERAAELLDLTYRPAPFHAESGIQVAPRLMGEQNDDVTFSCRWFVNEIEIEAEQGLFLPGEFFRRGDVIAVEVTPDLNGKRGRPVRSGEVEAENAPPRIVSTPPENFLPGLYRYQVEAVDADGDSLTYALIEAPPGMHLEKESGLLNWDLSDWPEGLFVVTVVVSDGFGGEDRQQFTMNPTFVRKEAPLND